MVKSINKNGLFEGYASVFNIIDEMEDLVLLGAFAENLQVNKIKLLWQHNHELPIGKILDIYEDSNGLYVKAQLILDVRQAQEAYSLLKSEVINGLSIGYVVLSHIMESGIRKIVKADLWEISLVTFPANKFAKVASFKSLSLVVNRAYFALKQIMDK
ncbi:MAG: HK97 family phage prohead protease [Rickettsiaceae bacterium H1]|nr:HK97 family phage prohead protease [Rickettsiaceae bacterium H1]